jgi:putative ABC transport system permease protein
MTGLWRRARSLWRPAGIPLAWRQLAADRKRFAVAVAGVAFGALLMLFQLGIYQAFMTMIERPIAAMTGHLVMVSPNFNYLLSTDGFPERRLYQSLARPEIKAVYPVTMRFATWRHPQTGRSFETALIGVRPSAHPFRLPAVIEQEALLQWPDGALFDSLSSPDHGPVDELLAATDSLVTEINQKRLRVLGTFALGQTLGTTGHVLVGSETFRRLTGRLDHGIDFGMIELRDPGQSEEVAAALNAVLPADVEVWTRAEFMARERDYWQGNTPIGFIVTAGMIIAMLVGAVIVYQILYTGINDHLKEYATLKALGLGEGFFSRLVLQQASILPLFGLLPALALAAGLFYLADTQGGLPTQLQVGDTLIVLGLSIFMCLAAGLLALRRLHSADPADIF